MIQIACPWCEQEAPLDADLLRDAGGSYTCAVCLTTVELVESVEGPGLALAA